MDREPCVDILMASFNGQDYIQEQIDSITNQTYGNWRLYIRDDGSTDGTLTLCNKAAQSDERICVINDKIDNLGFNRNYFRLLTLSTGALRHVL